MDHPRSAFGAPPRGADAGGPAKPDPRRPLDEPSGSAAMDAKRAAQPLCIKMDERDNVAIVANDGGLPAGTVFADGLTLVERVPQGHKVALVDFAAGDPV